LLSPHIRACVMTATLAASGICFAQSQGSRDAAPPPQPTQPLDLRIGVFRPAASATGASGLDGGAPVAGTLAVPMVAIGRDYRVGPNDLIDIEVLDLDNMKRTVRVNAAGAISLPLIGAVTVAGLTSQELETRIADRYREKYLQNPQISVFIKEFTTERITVEGAVVRPGIFPLTGQITLLRALALAGGFGSIANTSEVMLFRTSEQRVREVAVFDVDKIRAGKSDDPAIKGDDLIVVQRDSTRRLLKDSLFRDIVDSINPFSGYPR
jgi:polysaccharide export outer membrane protein